ncbi:MAG: diguanylate cyclase [Candidatus Gorgyraea atricola]|nr:diguanylate cyclase [Candidatus Gorgyraea atricola]
MMKKDFKEKYMKAQAELERLYEIGNAMHTTLNLEEMLYIILTAVTSHVGLSFNRAMLFLVNEKEAQLEGKMGIGPDSQEDASAVWTHIEKHQLGFDELIETRSQFEHLKKSKLNKTVKALKIPITEKSGVIALTVIKGKTFEIKKKVKSEYAKVLNLEEFVTVPLKARDKVIGVIVTDNFFNKKPITSNDVRMLTTFANQAGLAIQNSRLYERALVLSNSDSLTRLWNHGYFQYLLGEEIKYSSSRKQSFTILMIDIDDFKKFNDTHGHQAGDAILRTISDIFKKTSKRIDIVARYGGEEFVMLLPGTNKQEALVLAERLRKTVKESKDLKGITISIGAASFPEDAKEKEQLISLADKALYKAKRTGKNKVCT